MSTGRVFRKHDHGWEPVGEELPEWQHARARPNEPIAVWVLPAEPPCAPRDVIAFAETAHQLVAPVPRSDIAWHETAQSASVFHDAETVAAWLASVELWLCRRLPGDWRDG